jgi:hypothetical protein
MDILRGVPASDLKRQAANPPTSSYYRTRDPVIRDP